MEKLLEDGHLKLSSRDLDIHGVSGRAMLDALAAGQRDPKALAQLARGTMRGKIRRIEEALDCSFFTGEHAAVLAMMLAAIDHYTTQIEQLTARIEALTAPYLHQIGQLDAVRRHRAGLRPGHHRRDRHRHDRVPHRRPPGLLGQMVPPGQASPPGNARAATRPAAATPTWAPPSAKPPSAPAAPSHSSARATGG